MPTSIAQNGRISETNASDSPNASTKTIKAAQLGCWRTNSSTDVRVIRQNCHTFSLPPRHAAKARPERTICQRAFRFLRIRRGNALGRVTSPAGRPAACFLHFFRCAHGFLSVNARIGKSGGGSWASRPQCLVRAWRGRRLALFVLAAANLALILAVCRRLLALADIVAPSDRSSHRCRAGRQPGLARSRRWMPADHGGWDRGDGRRARLAGPRVAAARCTARQPSVRTHQDRRARLGANLTVLSLNTWHELGDTAASRALSRNRARRRGRALGVRAEQAAAARQPEAAYPFQVDCADRWACSLALLSRLPLRGGRRRAHRVGRWAGPTCRISSGPESAAR